MPVCMSLGLDDASVCMFNVCVHVCTCVYVGGGEWECAYIYDVSVSMYKVCTNKGVFAHQPDNSATWLASYKF
jgi:hypothetical protein